MRHYLLQEKLVRLYLRLNGYFLTSFIAHSPDYGKNATEVDCIGVRFPFHSQSEREMGSSKFLQIPEKTVDVIICEVKGGSVPVSFNRALRSNKMQCIRKIIDWIGIVNDKDAQKISKSVHKLLCRPEEGAEPRFKEVRIKCFSIRLILFAMDRSASPGNRAKYIHGQEVVDYIWRCLRPETPRAQCSTKYNYEGWGELADLVKYFKEKDDDGAGTVNDIYDYFKTVTE